MSFRLKTVLGIAAIEVLLLALLVFSAVTYLRDTTEEQLLDRAQTTARLIATMTADAVLALDLATLDVLVDQTRTNPDVAYVRVLSASGAVLSQAGRPADLADPFTADARISDTDGDGRLDVAHAIEAAGDVFGRVEIGLDTASLRSDLTQARAWLLTVAGIEVILVAVFGYLLGRVLTRQLTQLRQGARKLAAGELGYQVTVSGKDELADTAVSFNRMSKHLAASEAQRAAKEQELRLERDRAEQANQAKSTFLAMMSHEIRTPINGVLGAMSLLEDTALTADQSKLVRTSVNSGGALLQTINDILDFSKMEAGKLDFETTNFELLPLIDSVIDMVRTRPDAEGLALAVDAAPELPQRFNGDPGRLRQILLNLVTNAVKFTDNGHVVVRATLGGREAGRTVVCFEVEDTGPGIPADAQARLFDDFTTLTPTHSREMGGTGLGLAICRKLVTMMGGDIGCDSIEGEGATFWFDIELADPLAEEAHGAEGSVLRRPGRPDQVVRDATRCRLLLAEDNPTNVLVARSMLERAGYSVIVAGTGREAVDAANTMPFDAILMDIGMPEMDGMEATQAIRDLIGPAAQTPIIAMTAHVMPDERNRIMQAGMDDYLAKPASRDALIKMVEHWTHSRACPASPAPAPATPAAQAAAADVPQPPTAAPAPAPAPAERPKLEATDFKASTFEKLARETGRELMPTLFASFREHSLTCCEAIEAAAADADWHAVSRNAHALKSSAASFGCMKLHTAARDLEQAAASEDLTVAAPLADAISMIREQALASIDRHLAEAERVGV